VCVCVCVCVCARIYTCVCMCIYTCVCMCIYMCVRVSIRVCVYLYVCVCLPELAIISPLLLCSPVHDRVSGASHVFSGARQTDRERGMKRERDEEREG
jgi:hypothetical protein